MKSWDQGQISGGKYSGGSKERSPGRDENRLPHCAEKTPRRKKNGFSGSVHVFLKKDRSRGKEKESPFATIKKGQDRTRMLGRMSLTHENARSFFVSIKKKKRGKERDTKGPGPGGEDAGTVITLGAREKSGVSMKQRGKKSIVQTGEERKYTHTCDR